MAFQTHFGGAAHPLSKSMSILPNCEARGELDFATENGVQASPPSFKLAKAFFLLVYSGALRTASRATSEGTLPG